MDFTYDQDRAVRSHRATILVSAGAGSGKTTVLAGRVLAKLRAGIDVDRLVILTFTNAAAAAMRAKIKDEIRKDATLAAQLKKLDNAVISTFDSFTLRIVRQNHHLLGLPRTIEIADQAVLARLEARVLAETVAASYRNADPGFVAAIDRVWNGGDDGFTNAVKLLADGVRAIPDADRWLEAYDDNHFGAAAVAARLSAFEDLLRSKRDDLVLAAGRAAVSLRAFRHPKADPVADSYMKIAAAFPDSEYEPFRRAVISCTPPKTPSKSRDFDEELAVACRAAAEPFKSLLKKIKAWFESFFAETAEDLKSAHLETRAVTLEAVRATRRFRSLLDAEKRRLSLFGFDDVTAFAIRLLETEPAVRARYRRDIAEIMVDEYQDTNDRQDRLVGLLAAGSVFMVGDVKQSIYGFRDANPGNFQAKCRAVAGGEDGELIPLCDNFRSRAEVLDAVNALFTPVMDEAVGGVDYRKGHALRCGRGLPDERTNAFDYRPAVVAYDPGDRPPVAVEAGIAATVVRRTIEPGTLVLDPERKIGWRPCRYGDFCILVDRKADFAVYRKALIDAGIPVYAVADEKFVAASEILFVLAILKLVACVRDSGYAEAWFRHAFYAAARSFVYHVADDEMIPFLADRNLTDFPAYGLSPALAGIAAVVRDLSQAAPHLTAEAFLARLYDATGVYAAAATLPDPENAEAKLDHLLEKAATLGAAGFDGLFGYIAAIEASPDLDVEFARPLVNDGNAVLLMTIHKAKGLEFPFCIYPGLSKGFNHADTRGFFLFDRRFGLVAKAYDGGFKDTFVHALFRDALDRDMVSERIRLFYVALTRAREKLILILNVADEPGTRPEPDRNGVLPAGFRRGYDCYADLLRSVRAADAWRIAPLDAPIPVPFVWPEATSAVPPLFSFDLSPVAVPRRFFAKRSAAVDSAETRQAMAAGVRFHELLETFDFAHPESSMARLEPAARDRLARFLAHPELAGCETAFVRQELAFIDGTGPDAATGVIDFLMIRDGGATVVDYKLSHIVDPAYALQLAGYAAYVKQTTGLPVRTYLYSILDDLLVETGGDLS